MVTTYFLHLSEVLYNMMSGWCLITCALVMLWSEFKEQMKYRRENARYKREALLDEDLS